MFPWCAAALCAFLFAQDQEKPAPSEPVELSVKRVTLLQNPGAWVVMEGPAPKREGPVELDLPYQTDYSGIRAELVAPNGETTALSSSLTPSSPGERGRFQVTIPKPRHPDGSTLRLALMINNIAWKPIYRLDLSDRGARLSLDASIVNHANFQSDVAVEFSSATLQGEPTADVSVFTAPNFSIGQRHHWVQVFSAAVKVEETVHVRLGNLRPDVRPADAEDRAEVVLRLPNATAKFWPEGDLTVFDDGRPRATVRLPGVPPGGAAEIPLGATMGVTVTREERELERKVAVLRRENDPPDVATATGSATIVNRRGKAARFRVIKEVVGEVVAAGEDAKVTHKPNVLGKERRLMEIAWTFLLPAGESKRLTFGTKIELSAPTGRDDP